MEEYEKGELLVRLRRHNSRPIPCQNSVGQELVSDGPGSSAGSQVVLRAGRCGEGEGGSRGDFNWLLLTGWVAQSTPVHL